MDDHDVGRERGGIVGGVRVARGRRDAPDRARASAATCSTVRPRSTRSSMRPSAAGVPGTAYRELSSTKGHDAFLVEWAQLSDVLAEVLEGAAVAA